MRRRGSAPAPGPGGRMAAWHRRLDIGVGFGRASEEPYLRRGGDAARLGLGLVLVALLAFHAGRLSRTETSLFRLFNTLSNGLHPFAAALYRLGALWAVGLVALAALGARRLRLARDLILSGLLASLIARALGLAVGEGVHSVSTVLRFGTTPAFPLVRLAVITAVFSAASPYVTRPTRRVGQMLVVIQAASALYLGTAYPNDLLGGLVLGWAVAAGVHLAFGSPGGRPTSAQVAAALAQAGLPVSDVRLAPVQPVGATIMLARGSDGELRVKLIGRDQADARLVTKLGRHLFYKDSGSTLFLSPAHQLQHEAFTMLLARTGGVRTPDVVLAGTAGPGISLEVERVQAGCALADMNPGSIPDAMLAGLWRQLGSLHAARVSHGSLNGRHVVVAGPDGDDSVLVDFSAARSPTTPEHRSADVAELLVATSVLVGEQPAVAAALAIIGAPALVAALPLLQPAALSHAGRLAGGPGRKELHTRLDQLRQVAADATWTKPPPVEELHRVKTSNIVMAVGALLGVAGLLGAVGDPHKLIHSLGRGDPVWMAAAFILAMLTNIGSALALMGSVRQKLPLGPNLEVQVASSFSNLALPLGGTGLQVRFLQKQGVPLASAVAAGGLLSTVAFVAVQAGLLAVALWLSPHQVHVAGLPAHGIATGLAYGGAVLAALAALLVGIPYLRRRFLPPLEHALASLWEVLRSPSRMALLVSGNVVVAVLNGLCLLACLQAYGRPISFWTVLAVDISISTLSSLIPIPGGGTAVASVGLAGALAAFGVPQSLAVAAVLTNQIVASYLPAVPGWFATSHLVAHDFL